MWGHRIASCIVCRPAELTPHFGRYNDVAYLVLVILDRNVDLVPMLSHSWTYQALVNDVLGMKLNRVTVEVRAKDFSADNERRKADSQPGLRSVVLDVGIYLHRHRRRAR